MCVPYYSAHLFIIQMYLVAGDVIGADTPSRGDGKEVTRGRVGNCRNLVTHLDSSLFTQRVSIDTVHMSFVVRGEKE